MFITPLEVVSTVPVGTPVLAAVGYPQAPGFNQQLVELGLVGVGLGVVVTVGDGDGLTVGLVDVDGLPVGVVSSAMIAF
jgi:hypothetical protein